MPDPESEVFDSALPEASMDPFYILARTASTDDRRRVLKHDDTFAVFDRFGDIQPVGMGEQGLYRGGTRFLSRYQLQLGHARPLLLSSIVSQDNVLLAVHLTNPDLDAEGRVAVPRGTLHVFRSRLLWQGVCHERIKLLNYGLFHVDVEFGLKFEADFADIFEVRGHRRARRGQMLPGQSTPEGWVLAYAGLDGLVRSTRVECQPRPTRFTEREARFSVSLPPRGEAGFLVSISCQLPGTEPVRLGYDAAVERAGSALRELRSAECLIRTNNEQFNTWVDRAQADLHMLLSRTDQGWYPYGGVPWFATPFGRDGLISAWQTLWVNPDIAKGVLGYLAANQATEDQPERDAQPGKILHEARDGEMANLGEIPFQRYYGSIDATPLFIMLVGAYYRRTADHEFTRRLWPHVRRALEWMDRYGDVDGDGFLEYARQSAHGLVHQGWKDSGDAIFHADGQLAEGPVALCEVQGYAYAARLEAAGLAELFDEPSFAAVLRHSAADLQATFEGAFWMEDYGTYALALDGHKRPCRVRTSNAGQCLLAGLPSAGRAEQVAKRMLSEEMYSGWGIRTVAATETRYNPMSYHNGSVWPHDNALIAYGMARYGHKALALQVLTGLFDASPFFDLHRLPELFCGFSRRAGEGPTLYPVACSPQAWASGALFLLIQACLGLEIDAPRSAITFTYPALPDFLNELRIANLRVGETAVDVVLQRHAHDVGIRILKKDGPVKIVTVR